ncbi:MAG TPA: HK97 family phage prohead protease [Acidimicrobiales bacterium]|jgi:HK97 family phage prohead protease
MAEWSTAYVNDLPDSSFLLVFTDAKGTKQRYFPVKDADGKPDADHVRNALARIPQASTLTASQRVEAMAKAKKMAAAHPDIGSGAGAGYEGSAGSGRSRPAPLPADALGPQTRTFPLVLELRDMGLDGRTMYGRAVPYNVTGDVGNFRERFLPGVFARQIAAGAPGHIKLYDSHETRLTGRAHIGKTEELRDQPDGLYGSWRIFDTPGGNAALTMYHEGEITGLSIGFKPNPGAGSRKAQDGTIERVAGHLDHVALTSEPVYETASVLAVRSVRLDRYTADRERFRLLT